MQPQGVQKAFKGVHAHKNPNCNIDEHEKSDQDHHRISRFHSSNQAFFEKHFW